MKLFIIGRQADTKNYETFFSKLPLEVTTTLCLDKLNTCNGIVLPGGGDITPAFFGEHNNGSRSIDTELDILQFQALEFCIQHSLPVIGICKGLQVINVAFGGTIHQHLSTASLHQYQGEDQYHPTHIAPGSFLEKLYGLSLIVNSAHHQGIKTLGKHLIPIQWCSLDECIEAFTHTSLPIFGVQWHPERLNAAKTSANGELLLPYLFSFLSKAS